MSHILASNTADGDIPDKPGEWQIRAVEQGGVSGPYLYFECPRGKGLCGVPIQPSPPNPNGASWMWDGNRTEPTLTPSINCIVAMKDGKPTGGCGWHGFMRKGKLVG